MIRTRKIRRERIPADPSRALSSDIHVPCPEGLAFLPFQKAGIEYMLKRDNILLADEMGLGKGPMSVGVSNCDESVRKVLIVCPASLKVNLKREWERFDTKNLSVEIVKKTWPDSDVIILNYDILHKWRTEIRREPFDMLICDEAHFLKSIRAARTREVLGGIKRDGDKKIIDRVTPIPARRKLFLTGTPLLASPKDLWPILQQLDPTGLGSDWYSYAKRYCELFEITRFNPAKGKQERVGWKWDGAGNLEELQQRLRSSIMLRRLKKDVLTELPPKRRQVISIEPSETLKKLIAKEMKTYEQFKADLPEDREPPAFHEISKIRKETALLKLPFVIDYLKEVLSETEKVVVFAHHKESISKLSSAFRDISVAISGETPTEDRQAAVDRFQKEESCHLFIGSIQAAGTGLTLTAASTVIFAETDWTPAICTQCEDRLHRIGQTKSVSVIHIVLEGSLDEHIAKIVIKKQEISEQALDKQSVI